LVAGPARREANAEQADQRPSPTETSAPSGLGAVIIIDPDALVRLAPSVAGWEPPVIGDLG
jgi:hypothetical protein